jgi:DNA-binding MarR family transcriptional regulator
MYGMLSPLRRIKMLSRKEVNHALRAQVAVIREFRNIHPKFPSQAMQAFMEMAMAEGISVTELAETLGVALSTTSRNVRTLVDDDLVEYRAGHDPRIKRLYLTTKGHALVDTLANHMQ